MRDVVVGSETQGPGSLIFGVTVPYPNTMGFAGPCSEVLSKEYLSPEKHGTRECPKKGNRIGPVRADDDNEEKYV
jgi:hypothetical protein